MTSVAMIPQKELRNNIGEVLRRAEAGEEITITVSGRPVASLGPVRTRQWVRGSELAGLQALPPDPTLASDIEDFGAELRDPWAAESGPWLRLLLDTSVLIAGDVPAEPETAISTVSIAELHFGLLVAAGEEERALRTSRLGLLEARFPRPAGAR